MGFCPHCGRELSNHEAECPGCGLTIPATDLTKAADATLPGTLAAQPEEKPLEKGRVLGGRYEILEIIGKGGMGWVYKARDREIDRLVALKVIRHDLAKDDIAIKRFRDEIILARKVTHKNVLRIYDIAEAEGIKFISMPYIEGQDLKTVITEKGALGIDETIRIAGQVAHALKCAHEAGVIHRDLKPQNIMIDREGTAYVTDFGIAKSTEAGGLTVTGQIIGTPEYMSPEQAEGLEVDRRTDIYSFGLVVYEMLTGQVAFKADSIISTLMKRLREYAEPPSRVNPAVPAWLDNLTMKALERKPDDRYGSVDQILADIESQTVKIKRRLGRRSIAIAATLAGLAVIVAVALVLKPALVFHKARTYLAILPFENNAGESRLDWLVSGIPDNLTADLAQSKFFRIMSPERLRQMVHDLGADMREVAAPEVTRRLAEAAGLEAVAFGSFIKSGDEIRITLKVENARNQEILGTDMVKGSEADLLAMIDDLGNRTKRIFNLSQKDIDADFGKEAAAQRTKSVKAAAEFAKGLEFSYRGASLDAAKAFEAAISSDPDFAMAYAKAADAYQKLGYDEKAEQLSLTAVDKLVKFMDRVPPADRTFIMASHAGITNNADEAVESYKEFIAKYPDDPEGYYKLGVTYASVSEWKGAEENFRKAISLDPKFGPARFELGKVLINLDELDRALPELQQALKQDQDMGNREGEADALNAIGVVYKRKNDFEKALTYYQASTKIKEDLGDKRGLAASLGNIGSIYEIMGKREQALSVLKTSLEIRKEIGDKKGISTALNKIGQIYQSDGRLEEALTNYERSYELRKELGSKDLMASSLSDMGTVYALMGRFDEGVEMDSMALALRMETGEPRDQAQSLRNIAETLINRGQFGNARARLAQAIAIDTQIGDARIIARDNQALAQYYLSKGRVDSAMVCLTEALQAQNSIEDKPYAAVTMNFLGDAYFRKGEYTLALRSLDGALAIAGEIQDKELGANALVLKANIFYEIGYQPGLDSVLAALDTYDQAYLSHQLRCHLSVIQARGGVSARPGADLPRACGAILESIGREDVRCRGATMILCARAHMSEGRQDEAKQVLATVLSEARRLGLRDLEAESMWLLAQVLAKQGTLQEASDLAKQALAIADRLVIFDVDYLFTCGDISAAAGSRDAAATYYGRALGRAASVVEAKCPRRFKQYYLLSKDVPAFVAKLAGLLEGTGRETEVRSLKSRLGLK